MLQLHSSTHSLLHPLPPSLTHPLTPSLTHPLTPTHVPRSPPASTAAASRRRWCRTSWSRTAPPWPCAARSGSQPRTATPGSCSCAPPRGSACSSRGGSPTIGQGPTGFDGFLAKCKKCFGLFTYEEQHNKGDIYRMISNVCRNKIVSPLGNFVAVAVVR